MDERLMSKVEHAMEATGLSQAEILRMALAVGLEDMRRINYDLAGAIVNQAKPLQHPHLHEAEDPVEYDVKKPRMDGSS